MSDEPNQEQETPTKKGDITKQESKPQPPSARTIPKTQLECKNPHKENTNQEKEYRFQRSYLKVQIGLLIATTLAFIAAAIYALIAYHQLGIMRNATDATKESADATKDAVQVAKDALKANIDMAHREQRAWVGPTRIVRPESKDATDEPIFIKKGLSARFEIIIVNSGKSPAREVKADKNCFLLPLKDQLVPKYTHPKISVGVLQPNMSYRLITTISPLPTSDIDSIKNGDKILYVFGKITYEDIFRIPHWTTFCMKLIPSLDNFSACDTYNDAD